MLFAQAIFCQCTCTAPILAISHMYSQLYINNYNNIIAHVLAIHYKVSTGFECMCIFRKQRETMHMLKTNMHLFMGTDQPCPH